MIRQLVAVLLATVALHAAAAVELNQASQADLEQVAGIGPGLSAKILAARQSGNFKDWSDFVERVRGVGPGSATKMSKAGLTVGGRSYEAPAADAAPAKAARAKAPQR